MKLVSVIIPCYKDASTLGRAIKSVIAQTYPRIEIIVVNDNSPESKEIEACLTNYPQVCYLRNNVNVGLAATRNNGIAIAKGEILAFLDADDEYHPNKIALQVIALELDTVVTCGLIHVYSDGHLVKVKSPKRIIKLASDLIFRNTLNGAGLLIPKDLLLQHGGYDSSLRSCEDFDLWLRLLSAGIKVKDIGTPLYIYHFNPEGLSKNYRNITKWELEVIHRYATRMGNAWCQTPQYMKIVTFWIIRHLIRSELIKDNELRLQVISSTHLLEDFRFFKWILRIISRTRILIIPSLLLRLIGFVRSGTSQKKF